MAQELDKKIKELEKNLAECNTAKEKFQESDEKLLAIFNSVRDGGSGIKQDRKDRLYKQSSF